MKLWASLAAVAALSACGGGGSSSEPPAAAVPITQANYLDYAAPMGRSVIAMNGSTSATGGVTGGGSGAAASSAPRRAKALSATAHPQATSTFSDPCTFGGSMSGTATYANASAVTPGDSLSLTFSQCVEESGGVPLNGGMALQFQAFQLSPLSFNMSGSFTNFTAGTPALNGGFQIQLSEANGVDTVVIGFSGMKVGNDPTTFNTTLSGSYSTVDDSGSFSLGGSITTSGGQYSLSQVAPFTTSGSDPVGGMLKLTDSVGNAIVMTANADGTVVFAYYPKGATTPTVTSTTFTWTQFKG